MTYNNIGGSDVCAPNMKFNGGSCISLTVLVAMVTAYNNTHQDKIDISKFDYMKGRNPVGYKKQLVSVLTNKLKSVCDSQVCWLSLPFFKHLSSQDLTNQLHKQTFKPQGPKKTNEWLNTLHINEVFTQYEKVYKEFKFMGANPRDFDKLPETGIPNMKLDKLYDSGITKLGFVFNLDKHNQTGSHWVSMYADLKNGNIYYIDSVGHHPMSEFKKLMERIADFCKSKGKKIDMRYNQTQHQYGNSECGVYSISFILRLLDGETFDEIEKVPISDEEIQQCRATYFR